MSRKEGLETKITSSFRINSQLFADAKELADISITEKISSAANLFNIRLNDHIIISDAGFYSFANEGLL